MTGEDCGCEGACIDGKKSYCEPWGKWTNCREVGHCTRDGETPEADDDII